MIELGVHINTYRGMKKVRKVTFSFRGVDVIELYNLFIIVSIVQLIKHFGKVGKKNMKKTLKRVIITAVTSPLNLSGPPPNITSKGENLVEICLSTLIE